MKKKELIVSSAKNIILEKGYANASVEDITRNIGIAKGSFYTYFKSKHCVIDYILLEQVSRIEERVKSFFQDNMTLEQCIGKLVKARIIFDEDDTIKRNLMTVNLFRNIDSLNDETLTILRRIDELNVKLIEEIIRKYSIPKIKEEEIESYSKVLNDIINSYKNFNLFVSTKTRGFITDTDELREKYKNENFQIDIDVLIKSILKILTY